MIQDIIQYLDEDEGLVVFVDQQNAFDRAELEWVDLVLKTFNFDEQFRGWIQMLVKGATTSIKTFTVFLLSIRYYPTLFLLVLLSIQIYAEISPLIDKWVRFKIFGIRDAFDFLIPSKFKSYM